MRTEAAATKDRSSNRGMGGFVWQKIGAHGPASERACVPVKMRSFFYVIMRPPSVQIIIYDVADAIKNKP